MKRALYLAVETTGLDPASAGILEVGIVNDSGDVLFQSLVNPWPHKEWTMAEAVHGISYNMVKHAPLIHDLWPAIFKMVQGSRLVVYNAVQVSSFFPNGGLMYCEVECAKFRYARMVGLKTKLGSYRDHGIVAAANDLDFEWPSKPHRAIADALATRHITHSLDLLDKDAIRNVSRGTLKNYADAR